MAPRTTNKIVSAIIEIDGHTAAIEGGVWTCDDPQTLERLRASNPEQYLPDAANATVEALGGKIISAEAEEPDEDENGRQLIY